MITFTLFGIFGIPAQQTHNIQLPKSGKKTKLINKDGNPSGSEGYLQKTTHQTQYVHKLEEKFNAVRFSRKLNSISISSMTSLKQAIHICHFMAIDANKFQITSHCNFGSVMCLFQLRVRCGHRDRDSPHWFSYRSLFPITKHVDVPLFLNCFYSSQ